MASALIAWLRAPAPTTCTSTCPRWRITPAMAPATELGFDLLETFSRSVVWGLSAETVTGSFFRRGACRLLPDFTIPGEAPTERGGGVDLSGNARCAPLRSTPHRAGLPCWPTLSRG